MMTQCKINEFYNRLDEISDELISLTLDVRAIIDEFNDNDKEQNPQEYEELEYIWRHCCKIQRSF